MLDLKNVYRGREIKFYDFLKEKIKPLREEFLKHNPTWLTSDCIDFNRDTGEFYDRAYQDGAINKKDSWNLFVFKTKFTNTVIKQELRDQFPAAFSIIDFFGDDCTSATYSSFEPNLILRRHTGFENREAKNIRVHIPLIIPTGDLGLEVHGEEVHWEDIFAFNNQKAHSAWNLTNHRRLIFILDLKRTACDMPPAPAWFPGCNDDAPRFPKTETEGEIWQKTKN